MHMANAARSMVPASQPIAFLGGNYWTVAHQFVFHSDRTLERGDGEVTSVMRTLDAGGQPHPIYNAATGTQTNSGYTYNITNSATLLPLTRWTNSPRVRKPTSE